MTRSQETTQHYTPHATLAAVGLKLRSLKLFDTIQEHVHIKQKTIRHTPVEKLQMPSSPSSPARTACVRSTRACAATSLCNVLSVARPAPSSRSSSRP
jgi:hypothetical protein